MNEPEIIAQSVKIVAFMGFGCDKVAAEVWVPETMQWKMIDGFMGGTPREAYDWFLDTTAPLLKSEPRMRFTNLVTRQPLYISGGPSAD